MSDPTFGAWVRERRKALGMSQKAFAESAQISRTYACDIEGDRGQVPSMRVIERIGTALVAGRREVLVAASNLLGQDAEREPSEARSVVSGIMLTLSPQDQQQIVRFAQFVRQQAGETTATPQHRETERAGK